MVSIGAVLGLFLVGMGCVCLLDRDTVWQWTEAGNRAGGHTSERTSEWDLVTRACGLGCLALGLLHLAMSHALVV